MIKFDQLAINMMNITVILLFLLFSICVICSIIYIINEFIIKHIKKSNSKGE